MSKVDFRDGSLQKAYAGVVGVARKGQKFIRKRVIPSDPKTSAQIAYRQSVIDLTQWGRRIYPTVLRYRTDGVKPGTTKFNKFMQANKLIRDNKSFAYADLLLFEGKLYIPPISSFQAFEDIGEAEIQWSTALEGEAKGSDFVQFMVINETQNTWILSGNTRRSNASLSVNWDMITGDLLHAYMFIRYPGRNTWSSSVHEQTVTQAS